MKTLYRLKSVFILLSLISISFCSYAQLSVTISNKGSDYKVYVDFDADGPCQCNDDYRFETWRNNFLPNNLMATSSKRSGSVSFNVGPSTRNEYIMNMDVDGKNKFVFDCAISCEGSAQVRKTVSTATIKAPLSLSATQDGDHITLKWKKGTNMPNSHDDYYIYRDDPENKIGAVTGYTFTDENVGPGETHTYYIQTHTNYFGGHDSSLRSVVGRTRAREARATTDEFDKVIISWNEAIILTGARPREQTFTTVTPEIPFMILHDPPGDASYSFLEQNNTSSLAMRAYGKAEGSSSIRSQIKIGSAINQTLFPGTTGRFESWGQVNNSFTIGSSINLGSEWIMQMTNSELFSTSAQENITGDEGDVFIGAAMNLIYAQVDLVEYDPNTCSINTDIDLIMGNDGFATTFMYTEDHIEDVLIPQLGGIRDFYQATNQDSAALYTNQIAVWQQILDQNALNKRTAGFVENRSFSAGANYNSKITASSETSLSLDMNLFMESSIIIGAGYEVIGSGVQGEVETKIRLELGSSVTGAVIEEKTSGFELRDNDPGDFFSVDIKKDPVYGTPVFALVSGRSSCPWEEGTQPRETMQLQSDTYLQTDISPTDAAIFQLSLGNISQSDETQTYLLSFLQASNPEGAKVKIGGSPALNPIPYTIGPGRDAKATISIEKGPRADNYQDLKFVLSSGCGDNTLADTVSLNVYFQSTYPELILERPYENWLVNQSSNNELFVWFRGYDLDRLNKLQLQYSPKDQYQWQTSREWQPGILNNSTSGMAVQWNIGDIPEGDYDLRMRADYGDTDIFTPIIDGKVDRLAPTVFGKPSPTDGELNTGDLIMVDLNEALNCLALEKDQVLVKEIDSGKVIPAEVGCSGQRIIINPLWNPDDYLGSSISVEIFSVMDQFDNSSTEVIRWEFQVANIESTPFIDTDEDGIPDEEDNCPLSANPDQQDLDNDGIGDACDEDIDDDGILNSQDNCPNFANPNQEDSNGDGIGDPCAPEADGDLDGIANQLDNCPLVSNENQSDIDQDEIGDLCDLDIDGDGVPNQFDNCPTTPNPDQADANADDTGDMCSNVTSTAENAGEIHEFQLNPNPSKGLVFIDFQLKEKSSVEISVVHPSGQVIQKTAINNYPAGKHRMDLNLGALPKGFYFINLISEKGQLSKKIVLI